MTNVHLILYSNRQPFDETKKLIIESVNQYSTNNIIIHDYNLETIKQKPWFRFIKNLPLIKRNGGRDGYYNSWKPFIVKDVYDSMTEEDIAYYVDCSRHYPVGFNQNIDKLVEITFKKNIIAGSAGTETLNFSVRCCDNLRVWNKIIPNNNNAMFLNKMHILNSWFIMKKTDLNTRFLNEWTYFTCYNDIELKYPLITYHHTGDQSIFNILVYKYKLPVFYDENISHCDNKNKNLVLKIINNCADTDKYFIYP